MWFLLSSSLSSSLLFFFSLFVLFLFDVVVVVVVMVVMLVAVFQALPLTALIVFVVSGSIMSVLAFLNVRLIRETTRNNNKQCRTTARCVKKQP